MSISDELRNIVREEVRAAFAELMPAARWEGCLKLSDAGKLCGGISVTTLEKWGKQGLPIHRKGRVRVVDVSDLRAFIAKRDAVPKQTAESFAKELLGRSH